MSAVRNILKRISHPILKRIQRAYLKKPRNYSYGKSAVTVAPGVFPPFMTLSTKILLDYLEQIDITGKTLLELGCGSGIISVRSAARGAKVTATDVNPAALQMLRQNSMASAIEVLESDLFDSLGGCKFDFVIINPPYYPRDPKTVEEKAWFCGSDFGYFKKLFPQLRAFADAQILMILSEDCDIGTICELARQNLLQMREVHRCKRAGEQNYIFKIDASSPGCAIPS